jgi:phage terminase small subunit
MAELKNTRHELFCRGLVAGKTADQAYQDAGYKASRAHASRLAAKGNIRQRVSELHQSVAQAATVDRAWVLQQMRDLYEKTTAAPADGPTWSPATAKGVLELVGKEMGMFVDRKIIGIKRLEDMGDDELRQIAGEVLEELDAQVSVDGEVRAVEAELLSPPGGRNATPSATHAGNLADETNTINELCAEGN